MKKCDPRAFARCPDNRFCGNVVDAEFMDGSDCDKFNQSVLAQPLTNADRIRSMSNKNLAIFLCEWEQKPWAWKRDTGETQYWLQQSAEGTEHG